MTQPGFQASASSSTYGTPSRLASAEPIVDLPEPLVPTTLIRRIAFEDTDGRVAPTLTGRGTMRPDA